MRDRPYSWTLQSRLDFRESSHSDVHFHDNVSQPCGWYLTAHLCTIQYYLFFLAVDVPAAEDCLVQSLPVILLDFCFTVANVAKIFENFAHRGRG